jgi:predicted transcriptional regulator
MKKHLAILSRNAIKAIISGEKTVEARFSQKKIPPFGLVSVGDIVYMKPPGEDLIGQFIVTKILFLEGIGSDDWVWIKERYTDQLSLGSVSEVKSYFKEHQDAKYVSIMTIGKVEQFITSPIKIIKKDLRGWLVIDEEKHLN